MFTTSDRTADGDAVVIGSPGFDNDSQQTYHDPLDDVFGSAPPSPQTQHAEAGVSRSTTEPSDVPRLRSIHVTNGYREGIAVGKESSIQAGFDEGYALGAEYGHLAGRILGVLDGLLSITDDKEFQKLYELAMTELAVANLFSTDYFGEDSIWSYDVPEQDESTFRAIAAAHPLLQKWRKITTETATKPVLRSVWYRHYELSDNRHARSGNCCSFSACGRMKLQNITTPNTTHRMLTM
ncbi:hypothetical protein AMS68_004315 [Peltaster fructicola]|uniref:Protein YAE1 n=1 Tax=Peltaster fructicola TaxID=286661 RepID=A0A6H0XW23_9PEZI|nr:hypothetical protein AMS68_004315 [Peltaster fructicola]